MIKEEQGKQIVLDMKIASIIETYSKRYNVSLEEATDLFYNSYTMLMIERGIADMHCRSDIYLADELWMEVQKRTR